MESFRIGAAESVKKLKSTELPPSPDPNEMTSLTGRLGMSCGSKEKSAEIRVKLGRHVDANAMSSQCNNPSSTSIRLG
jgi:hypothetical protein